MKVPKKGGRKPARSKKAENPKSSRKSNPRSTSSASESSVDLEFSILEQFCAAVKDEEISLDDWDNSHKHLDLIVPVWLTADEFENGCERLVSFCRTIILSPESPPQKQPATCQVLIPPGRTSGHKVFFEGQGDKTATLIGDLVIVLYLKR